MLDAQFGGRLKTAHSCMLEALMLESDMIIGAVLIPGAVAPKLIRREQFKRLPPGCVL